MPSGLELSPHIQVALNARLSAWAKRFGRQFVLGLSGGGDSMALGIGCARWMHSGQGHVHAICVDHGLRDDAQREAQQTIAWAQALGLSAEIMSLNLDRGSKRLQERAREGRHRALLMGAKANNARMILLGHNLDDQNETVALRLATKTGLDGLAGMNELTPSPFYQDDWPCLLGRPLLDVTRSDLRHDLLQAGQSCHEDSSNDNPAFARIRARSRLHNLQTAGADVNCLNRIAVQAARLRTTHVDFARDLLKHATIKIDETSVSLSLEAFLNAPVGATERVVAWLAIAIGGAARAPEALKLARLRLAMSAPCFKGATLAGSMFIIRGKYLVVAPAPTRNHGQRASPHLKRDVTLRLYALSSDLDRFVTHSR